MAFRDSGRAMIRPLRPAQYAADGCAAAAFVLVCLPFLTLSTPLILAAWVLFAFASSLVIRRVSPAVALTVAWAAAIVQMAGGLMPSLFNIAVFAVLYATARYGTGWVRWYGLTSAVVGAVLAAVYIVMVLFTPASGPPQAPALAFGVAAASLAGIVVLGFSWTLGQLIRTAAAARRAGYERFQARQRQFSAEQTVAVEQERNRIARDMHDVVAHSLAVVVAQADGARFVHADDAEALSRTLRTISDTSRLALGDVRLLLSELRGGEEAGPQPGFVDLPQLVATMRSAGLDLSFTPPEAYPDFPTGRQIAVFRIAQEALTNALHHGDAGRPVRVDITVDGGTLCLSVTNTIGEGPPSPVPGLSRGHGISSMRERASLAAGTLSIDSPSASVFRLRAFFPLQP